jgi:O-antigen biosynthesis protein
MKLPDKSDAQPSELAFTGERFMPHQTDPLLALEHYHRYFFASRFAKNKRVLDIACGEGYGSAFLSKVAGEVIGIDSDAATIEHAKSKYSSIPNLAFEIGYCEDLRNDYGGFDIVLGLELLEHLDEVDQSRFLNNAKRVLNQDGLFILSSPEKMEYAAASQVKNQFHRHELTFSEFNALLRTCFDHVHLSAQRVLYLSTMWQMEGWQDARFLFHARKDLSGNIEHGESLCPPLYLIALCSKLPLAEDVIRECNSFYFDVSQVEETKELLQWTLQLHGEAQKYKDAIQHLQQQLDERTAWAMNLADQTKGQSETIARQMQEFAERTNWALSLADDLKEHKEYIAAQEKVLEKERAYSKQLDDMALSKVYRVLSKLKLVPRIRSK